MGVAFAAVQRMFREVSGGLANPAIAFGTIIWEEFTLRYDPLTTESPWTYELAASYFVGPFCGAILAGVCHNLLKSAAEMVKNYVPPNKQEETQSITTDPDISYRSGISVEVSRGNSPSPSPRPTMANSTAGHSRTNTTTKLT